MTERYDFECSEHHYKWCDCNIIKDDEGRFVLFEDYLTLKKEIRNLMLTITILLEDGEE